jgi:hypothetical protein
MVLIYESDPLDNEDARGRFYHVCRGRIDRTEIQLPAGEQVYECAVCGIDLEAEDFWLARQLCSELRCSLRHHLLRLHRHQSTLDRRHGG